MPSAVLSQLTLVRMSTGAVRRRIGLGAARGVSPPSFSEAPDGLLRGVKHWERKLWKALFRGSSGKVTKLRSWTRSTVTTELRELMALVGLKRAEHLASLLRNPGERYPSGGLVRTYLLGHQDAPERFIALVRTRRAEVEEQLTEGIQAVQIAEKVVGIYRVMPKKHVITILSADQLAQAELQPLEDLKNVVVASLAVPAEWVRQCAICGQPFVARSSRSTVCYRRDRNGRYNCRREAERRRRLARNQRAHEREEKLLRVGS